MSNKQAVVSLAMPAGLSEAIFSAPVPIAYAHALEALAECNKVDECKTWADKMQALGSYYKQSGDDRMVKLAQRIQVRALRRCGELLKSITPAKNQHDATARARGGAPPSRNQAAQDAGFSRDQRKQALRLANVPEVDFEREIESDSPPTVTEFAHRGTKKQEQPFYAKHGIAPEDFHVATRVGGELERFADLAGKTDQAQALRGMLPGEADL